VTRISVLNLTFGYSREPIFNNLSLELCAAVEGASRGRIYAVMGLSGSGKTTLFRLIADLIKPWSGRVEISADGSPSISYLPQEPIIFEHLTRWENAAYFGRLRATRDRYDKNLLDRMATRLRLREVLGVDQPATSMSGGELQRLSLLRAISIHPRVLLLDEPCTGLDVPVRDEFLMSLRELTDTQGLLVLYITHHADEARLVSDKIIFLSRSGGSVVATEDSLSGFVQSPPTPEAAQMLANEPLNVVPCEVDGDVIECLGARIRFASEHTVAPGKYRVAFGPSTAAWSASGIAAKIVGSSDRYSFVRSSVDPAACLVTAPRDQWCGAVTLTGDAFLFPIAPGRGGVRTQFFGDEARV
jgi:ABC-type multidrug transport system ATPase subunit